MTACAQKAHTTVSCSGQQSSDSSNGEHIAEKETTITARPTRTCLFTEFTVADSWRSVNEFLRKSRQRDLLPTVDTLACVLGDLECRDRI